MEDKLLHVIVGVAIVFIGLRTISTKLTIALLVGAAIGKELFDLVIQNERFDIFDALVTVLAGLIFIKLKNFL
jgi:hypothetical protein